MATAGADIVARMILQTGNVTSGVSSMSNKLRAEAEGIAASNAKIGSSAKKAANEVNQSSLAANKMSYNWGTMFRGAEGSMGGFFNRMDSGTTKLSLLERTTSRVSGVMGTLKSKVSGAATAIGSMDMMSSMLLAGAGLGILAFFAKSTAAAADFEDRWTTFGITMGKTGSDTNSIMSQWGSTYQKIQDTTGRSQTDIMTGLDKLSIAGVKSTGLMTRSMDDLGGAAFQTHNSMGTLEDAFQRNVQSTGLQQRSLKALGINMADLSHVTGKSATDITKQWKTMTASQKAALLDQAMEYKDGKSANEKFKESYQGLLQGAKNAFQGIEIAVGNTILPILVPALKTAAAWATTFAKDFSKAPKPIKDVGIAIGVLTGVLLTLGGMAAILKPILTPLKAMGGVIKTVSGALKTAIIKVGEYIASLDLIPKEKTTVINTVNTGEGAGEGSSIAKLGLMDVLTLGGLQALAGGAELTTAAVLGLGTIGVAALEGLKHAAQDVSNYLQTMVAPQGLKDLINFFYTLQGHLTFGGGEKGPLGFLSDINLGPISSLGYIFDSVLNSIIHVGNAIKPVTDAFKGQWDTGGLNGVLSALKRIICALLGCSPGIVPALKTVQSTFNSVFGSLSGIVKSAADTIKSVFLKALSSIQGAWSNTTKSIHNLWASLISTLKNGANTLKMDVELTWRDIQNAFNTAVKGITNTWNTMKHLIDMGVSGVIHIGASAITNAYNGALRLYNYIRNGVTGAIRIGLGALRNAYDTARGYWNDIRGWFSNTLHLNISGPGGSGVVGRVENDANRVINTLKKAYHNPVGTAIGAAEWVVTHAGPNIRGPDHKSKIDALKESFSGFRYERYANHQKSIGQVLKDKAGNCVDLTLAGMAVGNAIGIPSSMKLGTWDGGGHAYGNFDGENLDFARKALNNTYTPPIRGPGNSGGDINFEVNIKGDVNGIEDYEDKLEKATLKFLNKHLGGIL